MLPSHNGLERYRGRRDRRATKRFELRRIFFFITKEDIDHARRYSSWGWPTYYELFLMGESTRFYTITSSMRPICVVCPRIMYF